MPALRGGVQMNQAYAEEGEFVYAACSHNEYRAFLRGKVVRSAKVMFAVENWELLWGELWDWDYQLGFDRRGGGDRLWYHHESLVNDRFNPGIIMTKEAASGASLLATLADCKVTDAEFMLAAAKKAAQDAYAERNKAFDLARRLETDGE